MNAIICTESVCEYLCGGEKGRDSLHVGVDAWEYFPVGIFVYDYD